MTHSFILISSVINQCDYLLLLIINIRATNIIKVKVLILCEKISNSNIPGATIRLRNICINIPILFVNAKYNAIINTNIAIIVSTLNSDISSF